MFLCLISTTNVRHTIIRDLGRGCGVKQSESIGGRAFDDDDGGRAYVSTWLFAFFFFPRTFVMEKFELFVEGWTFLRVLSTKGITAN